MKRTALFAAVALICIVTVSHGTKADILRDYWPTCSDPASVRAAKKANTLKNFEEVERLGCMVKTPLQLRVRIVRCESSALDDYGPWFDYPIDLDDTLPQYVCEIKAWLPDGWRATLYTHYMNIAATH